MEEALFAAFLVEARGCGMAGLGYIYIVAQELLVDIVIGHELLAVEESWEHCSCSTNMTSGCNRNWWRARYRSSSLRWL